MKLLYGTGNLAKLSAMRNRLEQLDIHVASMDVEVIAVIKKNELPPEA